MKWFAFVFTSCVFLLLFGCGDNGVSEHDVDPPMPAITLDNFDDNNTQNVLGEVFGAYKVANMTDTNVSILWGGGFWWSYASGNGGLVISGAGDTIINGPGTSEDNPNIIAKLMTGGKLYVELNCQGLTGDYWAGVGCDLVGDYENPFIYDTSKYNDNSVYWDFSSLDSVRIVMRGMGAVLCFLESKAVKDKFTNPDEAWGFHGFSHNFGETMADSPSSYSFSVKDFKTTSPEAATVSWDDAKNEISAFVFELDTELDDRLEIEIDKIEFVGLDSTVVFPFLQYNDL